MKIKFANVWLAQGSDDTQTTGDAQIAAKNYLLLLQHLLVKKPGTEHDNYFKEEQDQQDQESIDKYHESAEYQLAQAKASGNQEASFTLFRLPTLACSTKQTRCPKTPKRKGRRKQKSFR